MISSRDNPFYKDLTHLSQKKYRDSSGRFLAEGLKFLDYPEYISHIIIDEAYKEKLTLPPGLPATYLSSSLFHKLSSQEHSQGVIALCNKPKSDIEVLPDRIIALDTIKDPGNLGTIIRTMDAAGFPHLFLTRGSVDIYNDKTIRSSMGSIFSIHYTILQRDDMIHFLKNKGYSIIITSLDRASQDYRKIIWPKKFVLIFGNESLGVSEKFRESADQSVHIPIYGNAESLNIAISAAILMYSLAHP